MKKRFVCALMINAFCLISTASAHYLWVTVDGKASESGKVNVYFEGGPAAGDGHYLDPFVKAGKTWIRTVKELEPQLVEMKDTKEGEKRWLTGELSQQGPRSIDSYGKWGVYRYGETDVLLHYYARLLEVSTHEDLHELARAKQMDLDIVPHDHGKDVELTVFWKGEAVPNRTVHIVGPKGFRKNVTTDEAGHVTFHPEAAGTYSFRTNVEEKKSGTDNEKEYTLIRHHATLAITLPLKK